MNVFNKVALQSLKKSRTRTFVTVIGVALAAALITSIATVAVSLQNYMVRGAEKKYGNWHVEVTAADTSFVKKQEKNRLVKNVVSFQNLGYALLDGGQNPDKPYLFVSGWEKETFDQLPLTLISGRLPKNSREILIPAHVASNGGVKILVGDTLNLTVGDRRSGEEILNQHDPYRADQERLLSSREETYKVVGICQRLVSEEYSAPGYTLLTVGDPTDREQSLTAFVELENPYRLHSYIKNILDGDDYVLNDNVLRFMGLSENKMLTVLLYSVGGVLVVLVMLGSIFLIYNSFQIALNERTHQFGILMSVGATEKQLRSSVLFEGCCVGALGIPLGILIGIPSVKMVLILVEKNFKNVMYDDVPLDLKVSVLALVVAMFISMLTILISAYLPAKKAASIPVMECLRQTNEIQVETKAVKTSKFAKRIYGLEGMLALKNFKRNRRRYRSIILSLTLSVVLIVSTSSFGIYLKQAAKPSEIVEDYDICFYTRDMEEKEVFQLYKNMKEAKGVYKSAYQAFSTYSCTVKADTVTKSFLDSYQDAIGYDGVSENIELLLDIQFVEDGVYKDLLKGLKLPEKEYTGQEDNMIMVGMLSDGYYMQEEPMELTLHSASGEETKIIHATFVDDYPDLLPAGSYEQHGYNLMVVAPYQMKASFDLLEAPTKLGMTFQSKNPGQSTEQIRNILAGANISADYTLYNLYDIFEQNRNLLFVANLFTIIFVIMVSLIAVANVFNTISTNIRLRRRELAMLRSVGMADRDFNRMMRFECVLYGVKTMLWGLPISGVFSWLIYEGMKAGGDELSFVFPWKSIGISTLGVFLVICITMLYVTGKVRKENIIDALRDDMA
ncbi:MAG: ABC transporter permease [Lachnospiraceae bacterium]|nr:ABC transporter permease [Lachnospiraceae bacterium]